MIIAMEHTIRESEDSQAVQLSFDGGASGGLYRYQNGVHEVTPDGIVLQEINPEFSVVEVQAATEVELIIPDDLKQMEV